MDYEEIVEKIRKIEKKRKKKLTEEQLYQAAYNIDELAHLVVEIAEKELEKKKGKR